jgi:hypothetical protein
MKGLFGEMPDLIPKGRRHPASPGSGPEGESCKTCCHCRRVEHHDQNYFKCALVLETRGAGTDIRLKSPACSKWSK